MSSTLPHVREIRRVLSALQQRRSEIGSIPHLQGCVMRGDSLWLTFAQVERLKWYGRACWLFHMTMKSYWKGPRYQPLQDACERSARAILAKCRVWRTEESEGSCGRRIESAASCEEWLELIEAVGMFVLTTIGFIDSENALGEVGRAVDP